MPTPARVDGPREGQRPGEGWGEPIGPTRLGAGSRRAGAPRARKPPHQERLGAPRPGPVAGTAPGTGTRAAPGVRRDRGPLRASMAGRHEGRPGRASRAGAALLLPGPKPPGAQSRRPGPRTVRSGPRGGHPGARLSPVVPQPRPRRGLFAHRSAAGCPHALALALHRERRPVRPSIRLVPRTHAAETFARRALRPPAGQTPLRARRGAPSRLPRITRGRAAPTRAARRRSAASRGGGACVQDDEVGGVPASLPPPPSRRPTILRAALGPCCGAARPPPPWRPPQPRIAPHAHRTPDLPRP